MSILGYWAVLQPIALNFGTKSDLGNGHSHSWTQTQLDTDIPAKTKDVEVEGIVE